MKRGRECITKPPSIGQVGESKKVRWSKGTRNLVRGTGVAAEKKNYQNLHRQGQQRDRHTRVRNDNLQYHNLVTQAFGVLGFVVPKLVSNSKKKVKSIQF